MAHPLRMGAAQLAACPARGAAGVGKREDARQGAAARQRAHQARQVPGSLPRAAACAQAPNLAPRAPAPHRPPLGPRPAQVNITSCAGLEAVSDNGGCGRSRAEEILAAWRPRDDDDGDDDDGDDDGGDDGDDDGDD